MSYPEMFWNNPPKLNWVSASFEIVISQGCLILITHEGGNYALRSISCQKSSCQSYTSSRGLFLSILSAKQLGPKARREALYEEIGHRRKQSCVQLCSWKGKNIFFSFFLKNIFWCYLIRVTYKYQTKHLWCVTGESSRSELPKIKCSFVLIKTTLSTLHFTFIMPLKHDGRVWLSSWTRIITLSSPSQYPPAALPSSYISHRWFRKYKDWCWGDTVKINKAHPFPLSIRHIYWVSALCQILC